jgi:hypothetical protein
MYLCLWCNGTGSHRCMIRTPRSVLSRLSEIEIFSRRSMVARIVQEESTPFSKVGPSHLTASLC